MQSVASERPYWNVSQCRVSVVKRKYDFKAYHCHWLYYTALHMISALGLLNRITLWRDRDGEQIMHSSSIRCCKLQAIFVLSSVTDPISRPFYVHGIVAVIGFVLRHWTQNIGQAIISCCTTALLLVWGTEEIVLHNDYIIWIHARGPNYCQKFYRVCSFSIYL